jgi:capsular exopolysaccharide synthesis family protein
MFSSLLRVIRTNIDFALSDKKSKIILITSHLPNEGKTFTAANLGAMLAVANRKVLLLDLDLHKPNLRSALGLTEDENSSITALLKKEIEIKDALSNTYNPNMDAIVSDKAIKGGSELLLSDVTQKVIDYGKEHYDYVIIDTPPVGLIPDALTLMNYSNMNIFVVNSTSPNLKAINQANDIVEKNNFKLFFILNKVNVKRLQYYSKYNEKYDKAYVA